MAALAAVALLPASLASAVTVPAGYFLDLEITQGASTWTGDETSLAPDLASSTSGDETTLELTGPKTVLGGGATIQDWDSTFDPDPFVTNNFVVVNNSGVTQTYVMSVVSPVTPTLLVNEIVQSNIILSINDDDNDSGASVSSNGADPVYEAFVNGSSELSFFDDPFSNSCANPVDCAINGTTATGVVSQAFGPVSATSMGITITFELSPGDSAAVQSRFEIVPEPALATLVLVGTTALGMAYRRRAH